MAIDFLPGQLVRTRRFALGVPDQFTVAPSGAAVLFLRSRAGDDPAACLWMLDLGSATPRLLADPADLLGADHGPGIDAYATDATAGLVAFALAGALWTVEVAGGRARRLPTPGLVRDPHPDPAGQRIAYVCAGALRVIGADGTGDRALAAPDGPDVTFGTAPLDGGGWWWSPDGARLLIARMDSAGVALWHVADPGEPVTAPRAVRYVAAGRANADASLWISTLDGERTEARWDRAAFEYLADAGWDAHGPYAVVQSRDQRTVRFLGIDPNDGRTTVLSEQRDDRWVQTVPGLPARTGSGALIAHTDRDGTRFLTVDGVAVTPPGLQLRAVLGVDGGVATPPGAQSPTVDDRTTTRPDLHSPAGRGLDAEVVLFTASEEPTETHLWSYQADAGIRRLSTEPGVHSGVRSGGTLVHVTRSSGVRVEVVREGKPPVAIESLGEWPALGVPRTQLILGSRELRAALFLPSWHRPGSGRLPVLLDPYGGASRQRVTAELDWRSLVSQWFAEQGFAVLVADGRGTPGRGPDWEREVHGDVFTAALDDQVAALQAAARRYPELDLTRVGIRGWSFGGSLAALAVLRRPDVFHVAVAGAGVTDQRLYHAYNRERFLGHPDEFPQRYEACSLISEAPTLSRPLLLMHGLADTNVFPVNTLRLSEALLAAGRSHEVLLLPGIGHRAIGAAGTENLLWHQLHFLQRHLDVDPAPPSSTDRTAASAG